MQTTTLKTYPIVTADGTGVVSHAGAALLSEMADRVGLTAAFSEALHPLRQRRSGHDPGRVLVDVAVAIADGAETISDVQALADQPGLHGPVASTRSGGYWTVWTPTCWMSFGWACLMVCVRGCPDSETGWSWEGALNGRDDR